MKFSATTGITLICAAGFLVVSVTHAVEPTTLPKPGGVMMKGGDKDGGKGGKDKMRTPGATKMKEGKDGDKGGKGGKDKMRSPGAAQMKGGDKDGDKGGKGGKDKMRSTGSTLHKGGNENIGGKGGKDKMRAPGSTGVIGEEGMQQRPGQMGR